MAGIGSSAFTLAEAYSLRALYNDKLRKNQQAAATAVQTNPIVADYDEESKEAPSGCFFLVFKKNHSAKVLSITE